MKRTENIYRPIPGGIEITNGSARYSRPLYSTHVEDPGPDRYLYIVGDKPDVVLSKATGSEIRKYAHLFLEIQGGKRLSEMENITARYVEGREEYSITDSSFAGSIELTMTRTDLFDGLIIVARLPKELAGKLRAVAEGGIVTGVPLSGEADEMYFLLTTEEVGSQAIQDFLGRPQKAVESGRAYYRNLLDKVKVRTPDPYFDSAVSAQLLGMDAAWSGKNIMHGSHRWYVPHAGWRSAYGETAAGFSGRVKENARQFFAGQDENGRITDFPDFDKRYNMGEVMVDQLLYNWLWDGDLEFFRDGGYDFIKNYLRFEQSCLGVPGTSLYENWLNAWNTDNKWCNGGAGTIASSYMWRAHKTMADIAARLGKEEDSREFARKADEILADMKRLLWDEEKGIYGEYRDRFGKGMLHSCPDLSSIYTPIDEGVTDLQESHRMLRYAEEHFRTLEGLGESACFPYSSDWEPLVYSSDGLYPGEVLHTALAYFQTGQAQKGYAYLKGVMYAMYHGLTAGPGLTCHEINARGENDGRNTDFADVCSMFVRTTVEGVFGIRMNLPDKMAMIMPGMPKEWDQASIETEYLSYRFCRENNEETFYIESRDELTHQMRVSLWERQVKKVRVSGTEAAYTMEEGQLFITVGPCRSADVEVIYEEAVNDETVNDKAEKGEDAEGETVCDEAVNEGAVHDEPVLKVPEGMIFQTISLDSVVNQNLSELHKRVYTISCEGRDDYILPKFYFVRDTTRSVTANGRSWWEKGRGAVEELIVPSLSRLPAGGGILKSDAGIPFAIPDDAGKNAAFVSLYQQFPERLEIPVKERGKRIYFLLCVSTNHMQAYVENAVLEVRTSDGVCDGAQRLAVTSPEQLVLINLRRLVLVNPQNIDDWLNYQTDEPYAQSGCIQPLGERAHANILCMDLGEETYIESVTFTCIANEVLAGLLGITIGR